MPDVQKKNTAEKHQDHYLKPDYSRPRYQIPAKLKEQIKAHLKFLYGARCGVSCYKELERLIKVHAAHKTPQLIEREKSFRASNRFSEKDVILITYGDLVRHPGEKPLKIMQELVHKYLHGVFNTIHILPFFPYSSDRGFAVMDFEQVDPRLGSWEDLLELKPDFKLMFDGVFNHVSSKSRWFQEFLNQNPEYLDFFTVFSTKNKISADHLKLIVRPRTSELLSTFCTLNGKRMVWTTFSPDQIDLNFHNPRVLLKMIEIMLTYVRRGADLLRLDAVTYLWEELGTSCVHLEQTHEIIRLFRAVLNAAAPHTALITETNVAHRDNVRYFGNGSDEAQMVYNFALPPLVLHSFQTGDSTKLTAWAASLKKVSDQATFFNFLDSHDGVGVMAAKGILSDQEIEMMALRVLENGGYISYKGNGDGSVSPYEMNITWWSAINNEDADETLALQVDRYIASRAAALVLMGVPGVYLHGLLGSENDAELVIEEKQTRSINRKNVDKNELLRRLQNPDSKVSMVSGRLTKLIRIRIKEEVFHPNSPQKVLSISKALFTILRFTKDKSAYLVSIINISGKNRLAEIPLKETGAKTTVWYDLISGKTYRARKDALHVRLKPYQIVWLKNIRSV